MRSDQGGPDAPRGDWRQRLDFIVATMKEMSVQVDPQAMVRSYRERMRQLIPTDRALSLSRRGLEYPRFRVTRSTQWKAEVNPWTQKELLPLIEGGLLAELIYADAPVILNDLRPDPADPAFPFLEGMRSLLAIPNFDGGVALNMTVSMSCQPNHFDVEALPERVWMSNLFGRATGSLVLKEELRRSYEAAERELEVVADIQRSLLPRKPPAIPNLSLAAHYRTSRHAGGDYYDFLELSEGKWGLLIADVSGHGTPAAVIMAITHAIAHGHPGHPEPPSALLRHVNDRLTERYTTDSQTFVTAFYGIFDPATRTLTYACAGHNAPRLKRCADGSIQSLDGVGGFPLGLFAEFAYDDTSIQLASGDQIVFYTDGVTDAVDPEGRFFGVERLDRAIAGCKEHAVELIAAILAVLEDFCAGQPPEDDQTLLVAKVV